MSECVVRMEMPKKCVNCRAWCICGTIHKYMLGIDCDSDWTYDDLLVLTDETGFIKPDDCPIICSLPEGHGNLVDGDMPISEIEKYITIWDCHCSEFGDQTVMAVGDLGYLPIVVPAEAERSET